MKREHVRTKHLPAFSLDLPDLGALLEHLAALFQSGEKLRCDISIERPGETLEFDSVDDLKAFPDLPARSYRFSIALSQDNRRLTIYSGDLFSHLFPVPQSRIKAWAETDAWCAAAIEAVHSSIRSHRVWYYWFMAFPIVWPLTFLYFLWMYIWTSGWIFIQDWMQNGLLDLTVLIIGSSMIRELLPRGVLRFAHKQNYFRRNSI